MHNRITNILIVRKHNQIGDILCSLSLYKAIKKKYPDSHITLVASKTNYEIPFFELNPYINRVLVYDKSSISNISRFFSQLKDRLYDFGFVPSTIKVSRTSHIINYLAKSKIRVGVKSIDGVKNKSSFLLNLKYDFNWKDKHQLIRNLEIAKLAGFDLSEDEIKDIKINFSDGDIFFAKNFINENFPERTKKIIAFHPGAGKLINTYPTEKFLELIKKLYNKYYNYVLITSGWTDKDIVNKMTYCLNKLSIKYKVVHNLPVKKLGAILSMVDLFITNDTGTMHIAGFSGARVISLFGPTNPLEWSPIYKDCYYIKSKTDKIFDIDVEDIFNLSTTIIK